MLRALKRRASMTDTDEMTVDFNVLERLNEKACR